MKCPICGHSESSVVKTDRADDAVRRRRQCVSCGYRWSTDEVPTEVWKQHKSITKLARAIAAVENDPRSAFLDSETGKFTITIVPDRYTKR